MTTKYYKGDASASPFFVPNQRVFLFSQSATIDAMKKTIKKIEEMEEFASEFVKNIEPEGNSAVIIGLYGDLGSGKTTFVKCVAEVLGVTKIVTSPTFVIEKIYKLDDKRFDHLVHIDAYRLENGNELKNLGFEEIIKDSRNIVFIEWPERVREILPENKKDLSFTFIDENTRIIEYS